MSAKSEEEKWWEETPSAEWLGGVITVLILLTGLLNLLIAFCLMIDFTPILDPHIVRLVGVFMSLGLGVTEIAVAYLLLKK